MARSNQVAALPWRRAANGVEILMITTRTTRRWVIPKGWPMAGKADHDAAAIEAYEEAGVRGRISPKPCGQYDYAKLSEKGNSRVITVTAYALQVATELTDWPERHERERRWMSVTDAVQLTGEPELAPLLRGFVAPDLRVGFWQQFWQWLSRG